MKKAMNSNKYGQMGKMQLTKNDKIYMEIVL